jgi:glycerol-3-phosphate acyltransferase PlsY
MSKVNRLPGERGHPVVIYLYVLLLSWLWGSLKLPIEEGWRGAVLAVGKGAAAIFAAKMVNDTGLTMTIALIGVVAGQAWSPLLRFKERPALWVAWGALMVFAPLAGALAALSALLIYYLAGSAAVAQLGVALFIPFLLWQLKELDIYIIFGLINTIFLTYQAIPLLNTDRAALRKRLRMRQLLAVVLIIFIASTLFFNRYVYQGFGKQVDIFRRGTGEFKVVALTFDDGPDPAYTPAILDILKEYDIPATFFMVGRHVERYPGLARRIADEGHSLGNHTWSHRRL